MEIPNNHRPFKGTQDNKGNHLITNPASAFVAEWKEVFTEKIKSAINSTKRDFNFIDALKRSKGLRNGLDKIMIEYLEYLRTNPLENNDFFKYVNAYKKGKELNTQYFKHDLEKLQEYYDKADKNPEYNPFSLERYKTYVLYMMLKFYDHYLPEYDTMFGVKTDKNREYNPLTSIPSVFRYLLPFGIKEYDIAQAYASFIFLELGMEPFDVYSIIDKKTFHQAINANHTNTYTTIEKVRNQLRPIYGERVNEVITQERYDNKGRMFEDLARHEAEQIAKFVEVNKPAIYVRLHDGVVVLATTTFDVLEFGNIKFKVKEFIAPELLNGKTTFYKNQDGKQITTPVLYAGFLVQEGIIRVTRPGHDAITILRNKNRIVAPINHKTDLVPWFKAEINEFDTEILQDRIARDASNTILQSLQLLVPILLQYHRDTKTQTDISFENGIARITANKMELMPYDIVDGFFAKHSTQEHTISFNERGQKESDFSLFLQMAVVGKDVTKEDITEKDRADILAFYSMFGYLISNYKNPAFNPAIILSDANADGETRNGGRGKSLVQMALTYFRPSIQKGGNAYDPKYTHVHADVRLEHDIFILDDVSSSFDYNALYTLITGALDAQRKGVTAETIPFEDAPKFVISTNWAVRYEAEATSTNRRFKEYQFSRFWNINNTPDKYFGKSFFTEWGDSEWNDFFNFGFSCVQHYLKNGLQTIQYDKDADNYQAYFYNDAILLEVTRIFDELILSVDSFGVTDFIREHRYNEFYQFKPEFTIRNARKYIEAFIDYNKLPFIYSTHHRKWELVE